MIFGADFARLCSPCVQQILGTRCGIHDSLLLDLSQTLQGAETCDMTTDFQETITVLQSRIELHTAMCTPTHCYVNSGLRYGLQKHDSGADSGAVRLFGAPLLKAPQAVGLSSMHIEMT
eukprot:symbB.v1.2.027796.t1/scaffold2881.1/size68116/1